MLFGIIKLDASLNSVQLAKALFKVVTLLGIVKNDKFVILVA